MVARIVVGIVTLMSVVALAKAAPAASKQAQARRTFRKAQKLFKQERYKAALPLYEKAYELSNKRPSAAFGLAQCERVLKMYDASIQHFLEYLAAEPGAANAEQVRQTIALLEAERVKQAEPPPPPEVPPSLGPEASSSEIVIAPSVEPPVSEVPPMPVVSSSAIGEASSEVEDSGSFFTSPVFWIVAGVAVAAGGAVALGFALSGEADPYGGNTNVLLSNLGARN